MGKLYFYQSTNAVNTPVDMSNPLHKKLYDLLVNNSGSMTSSVRRRINATMKAANFKPGVARDFAPFTRWSSDIYVVERDDSNMIVRHLT